MWAEGPGPLVTLYPRGVLENEAPKSPGPRLGVWGHGATSPSWAAWAPPATCPMPGEVLPSCTHKGLVEDRGAVGSVASWVGSPDCSALHARAQWRPPTPQA